MSEATGGRETGMERAVERAVEHAVFGGARRRREFVRLVGAATASAALASVFPLAQAKALAQDKPGPLEKRDLKIGFIPITCATPIIMAEPMGFFKKYGLNAQVVKASSWAMIRDLSINGETDATHMLSPMPLAISLGVGSQSVPYVMPAVENINGQAITLANKHKGVKSAADMKGFKFGVPFDFSMHNFLLRYVLAEGGVDPDKDVQIHVRNHMLEMSAERREETKSEDKGRYRSEFRYGSFTRTVQLPPDAGEQDVKATYKDGILEVRMPLDKKQAEVTRIEVQRA